MTIGEWLGNLQDSDSSSEEDSQVMQKVLRTKLGFRNAVVIYGVVYLDGQGTMANPPMSIQAMAKSLLSAMKIHAGKGS